MSEPKESRERDFIELLRQKIESELKWGPVTQWTQRDFQSLSDILETRTKVHLGITTLKRLLGRVSQKGLPYLHTLDVMAQFLGFENWIDFKKQNAHQFEPIENNTEKVDTGFSEEEYPQPILRRKHSGEEQKSRVLQYFLMALVFIFAGSTALLWYENAQLAQTHGDKAISCELRSENAISDSFPHLVNFSFHCPDLDPNTLNIISFGPSQMQYAVVDKRGIGTYSHLYTEPGIFQVKVFSNKTLVGQKAVLISSGGWKGSLHPKTKQETPVGILNKDGAMTISMADVKRMGDTSKRFHTSFYIYKELGVEGDNFQLQARLKNSSKEILNKDKGVFIRLWGENDYHMIQVANAFRREEIFNRYSDVILDSASTNSTQFQKFIHETDQWFLLKVEVKDLRMKVFFNEDPIVDTTYTKPIGDLMGIETSFVGTGEVDFIRIFDKKNNAVLKEEF